MAARTPAPKSGRQGSKKVRTGCGTCKVRRVKCDEGTPACQRCINAGRACHGYQGFGDRTMSRRELLSYQGSLLAKLRDFPEFEGSREGNFFEFFFHVTAPSLALDLDSEFWRCIMPQFCHTEEPLRHAALAVGGFHKAFLDSEDHVACSIALRSYTRAIKMLRSRLDTASGYDLPSMLLITLLFVCIEYLQGNEVIALRYLQQGRQLMRHWIDECPIAEHDIALVQQTIVPLYQRQSFTMCMFGAHLDPIPEELVSYRSIPVTFVTLGEARQMFYSISDSVWCFISTTSGYRYGAPVSTEVFCSIKLKRDALLRDLSRWHTAFSLFRVACDSWNTSSPSTVIMLLHYHATTVWLGASISVGEACYDSYIDTFSTIICLAREYLQTMRSFVSKLDARGLAKEGLSGEVLSEGTQHRPNHSFIFETHIIPILYFTAVKCRHSLLRKSALGLLEEMTSIRENLWQGNIAVSVAKCLIDIETESPERNSHGVSSASSSYAHAKVDPSIGLGHVSCLGHNFPELQEIKPAMGRAGQIVHGDAQAEGDVGSDEPTAHSMRLDFAEKVWLDDLFPEALFGISEHARVTDAILEPSKDKLRRITLLRKIPGAMNQWDIWQRRVEIE